MAPHVEPAENDPGHGAEAPLVRRGSLTMPTRPILVPVVVGLLWLGASTGALRARPRDPAIGQVVDADTGQPLAGALVRSTSVPMLGANQSLVSSAAQSSVLTGPDGSFTLPDIGPHQIHVVASLAGYSTAAYGQRFPGDSVLAWDPGDPLIIRLERMAVIAGEVHDDAGAPVVGVLVVTLRRMLVAGEWRYVQAAQTVTTDQGAYRLTDLLPGRHLVAVTTVEVRPGIGVGSPPEIAPGGFPYPTTFFPTGTSVAGASEITVGAGDAADHVNINLQSSACVPLAGTVVGPAGPVVLALDLVADDGTAAPADLPTFRVRTAADGSFRFACATAGAFHVRGSAAGLWVDAPIAIGSTGLEGLVVSATPARHVNGQVTVQGPPRGPTPPGPETLGQLVLSPDDGRPMVAAATIAPDGSFALLAPPGRYVLSGTFRTVVDLRVNDAVHPANRVEVGPADLTGLTVALGWGGSLSGDVPLAGVDWRQVSIYVFPQNDAAWTRHGRFATQVVEARLMRRGSYAIGGLLPGSYWVVAATSGQADWTDPKRLAVLATVGTAVDLVDGENIDLNLTAMRVW